MAISAIHSELSDMNIVGKRNRLDRLISHAHIIGSQIIPISRRSCTTQDEEAEYDLYGQVIRPARKDISHATSQNSSNVCERRVRHDYSNQIAYNLPGLTASFSSDISSFLKRPRILASLT